MQEGVSGAIRWQTARMRSLESCYYCALYTLECAQSKTPTVVTWIIPALFQVQVKHSAHFPPHAPMSFSPSYSACCWSATDAAAACADARWLQRLLRLLLQPLRLVRRLLLRQGSFSPFDCRAAVEKAYMCQSLDFQKAC